MVKKINKKTLQFNLWRTGTLHNTYLSDKYSEDQQCKVPGEKQEAGTDPQVVEQGEIQQSSYGVETMGRAADGAWKHIYSSIKIKSHI